VTKHCITNGWTIELINNQLSELYGGLSIPPSTLKTSEIIKYKGEMTVAAAKYYFRTQFERNPIQCPWDLTTSYVVSADEVVSLRISHSPKLYGGRSVMFSSILAVSCAIAISRVSGQSDHALGITISGRTLPLPGIDKYMGSLADTMPQIFRVHPSALVDDMLTKFQANWVASSAFEANNSAWMERVIPNVSDALLHATIKNIHPPSRTKEEDAQRIKIGNLPFLARL
jgi:hypothetical protein